MTMEFLLHKDKKKIGKPTAQKQECGCPSLQFPLRSHTHAFLTTHGQTKIMVRATTISEAKTINLY